MVSNGLVFMRSYGHSTYQEREYQVHHAERLTPESFPVRDDHMWQSASQDLVRTGTAVHE